MKKFVLFTALLLCIALLSAPAWAAFSGGDGSAGTPYIITTAAELDAVRDYISSYFKLGSDIDLAPYLAPGGAGHDKWGDAGWLPIAERISRFRGSFDGGGSKITGLWINRPDMDYVGLFRGTSNAVIANLSVEIAAGRKVIGSGSVGGLVGRMYGGLISASNVSGDVSSNGYYVGGLVGYMYEGNVTGSHATGDVSSGNGEYVGGLVGYNEYSASISASYATGNVSGRNRWVGGLVGRAGYPGRTTITACYATGNVSSSDGSYVGGLVGDICGNIEACYATGDVSGKRDYVGGLVGDIFGSSGGITSSYATGNVSGDGNVGGLAGRMTLGSVTACYATGDVSGSRRGGYAGGLIGMMDGHGSVSTSYATGDVSNSEGNAGGLMGCLYDSNVTDSYATGDVSGSASGGGLVGYMANGGIKASYVTGSVRSANNCGALVGLQDIVYGGDTITNTFENCYRYESVKVNGVVVTDNDPNGEHGGKVSEALLRSKATYQTTHTNWQFDSDEAWHWDAEGFPKLGMGKEKFPFRFGGKTATLKVRFQGRADGSDANIENLTVKWIEGGKATDIGLVTTGKDGTAEITLP